MTLAALAWSSPEARRFQQRQARARLSLYQTLNTVGTPAVLVGFESLTGGGRLFTVFASDTFRLIAAESS